MYLFNTKTLANSDKNIVRLAIQNTDSGFPPNFNAMYANGKAAQSIAPTTMLLHFIWPVAWNIVVRGVFIVCIRHRIITRIRKFTV